MMDLMGTSCSTKFSIFSEMSKMMTMAMIIRSAMRKVIMNFFIM